MTYDEKLKYLQRAFAIQTEINEKVETIKVLKERAESIISVLGHISRSGREDKLQKCISKAADLENEIIDRLDDLFTAQCEIQQLINSITNPLQRTVLEYRYIQLLTFEEIAAKIHYTITYVFVIHRKAVKELDI